MAEDKTDRLSSLPDDIRHHILSFLPDTKHRARTALLSKSWRYSWAHHPDIRFSLSSPIDPAKARAHASAISLCLQAYRAPFLQTLHIDLWSPGVCSAFDDHVDAEATSRWFRFAASRSVNALHVTGRWEEDGRLFKLPVSIFSCSSLRTLHLFRCSFPEIPSDIPGFPSLRALYIDDTEISSQALDVLLSTSPALEDLQLSFLLSPDGHVPCSSSLTKPIRFCSRNIKKINLLFSGSSQSIDIDVPFLDSISFNGDLTQLSLNCSPVLTLAFLFHRRDKAFRNHGDWMRVVSSVSQVKALYVNGWFLQFILGWNYPRDLCPIFKNLKTLLCMVDWLTQPALLALASVLRACPSLSDLHLLINGHREMFEDALSKFVSERQYSTYVQGDLSKSFAPLVENFIGDQDEDPCNNPSEPFKDFETSLHQLKGVTIEYFMGSRNEMKLVNFILKNAVSLKALTIFDLYQRDTEAIHALLSPFARASSHVQIYAKPPKRIIGSI